MKRFLGYCLLLSLPLLVMLAYYVVADPFKVIWHYDVYYQPDNIVNLNRGFVSAKHYSNHYKDGKYDSFIFGNSRSIAYYCEEWEKYLPDTSRCYHFDVSSGSVGELLYEIKFIKDKGTLKNALLVLDSGLLSETERDGILFSMPPILKGGEGTLNFQKQFFTAFYSFDFFRSYIDYRINREYKQYMDLYIVNIRRDYNPKYNELGWAYQEKQIAEGTYYDHEKLQIFESAQFPDMVSEEALDDERKEMLKEIKSVFDAQKTDYRIVIGPQYDQVKINPFDLQFLCDVFGKNHVFDYSGVNKWNEDYHNYYETSHYRPCVANEIMSLVYSDKL